MDVNYFIKDDFIPEGDGQVASGSAPLLDRIALETEEQSFEREQDELDFLEALGLRVRRRRRNVCLECACGC